MSQPPLPTRGFPMVGNNNYYNSSSNSHNSNIDTTYTKLFVGGLAWETQRDTMRHYFEQFGEIQEAVVITDKNTGRSKGYGFVTFKDPDSAARACQNPSPVIDGRRANCNLASLGAHKPTRPPPLLPNHGRFRGGSPLVGVGPSAYQASPSTYFHQPTGQYTQVPYSPYGYSTTGYSQDNMLPMNYYSQQYSPYYAAGVYANYYPYYAHQYSQPSQGGQGLFGVPYPLQYPYLSDQRYASSGPGIHASPLVSTTASDSPTVINMAGRGQNPSSTGRAVVTVTVAPPAASQVTKTVSDQQSTSSN